MNFFIKLNKKVTIMGSTKKHQYNQNQLNHAKIAKAIGHPARVTIIQYLSRNEVVQNKELPDILKLNGSTIVQHLQELQEAGIISEDFIGNKHVYFLQKNALKKCMDLVEIFWPKI